MSKTDGRYVPKKEILYWHPVTTEMDYFVNALMNDLKLRNGYHPPKFQMIDECIRAMAKEKGIDAFVKPKFVVGNK